MTLKFVELEEFTVVGIEVRTSNSREMTSDGVIAKHWMRYFQENIAGQIAHKVDDTLYAIYTNYESDHRGEYTFCLGIKVDSVAEPLPKALVAKKIPKSRYAVFTTATGAMDQVVIDQWKKIWLLQDGDFGKGRAYQADFEVYDHRVSDFQHAQIEIFVGVS